MPVTSRPTERISFVTNGTPEADIAARRLRQRYGDVAFEAAEVVVALGGDGLMLQTLHRVMRTGVPVYGMNFGSVGFMMNDFSEDDLGERLAAAQPTRIYPLSMQVIDTTGQRRRRWRSTRSRCSAPPIRRPRSRSSSMAKPGWKS